MKTYTICGSMKFATQMKEIAWELESIYGYNILQCVYNDENKPISQDVMKKLGEIHYRKIDLSDGIYVVDINGYIGSSVKTEIEYALKNNKEVIYHSQFK
ncbi:MAG: hypothetical protein R3Y35_12955 [Clostridia bacterium]